MEAPMIDLRTRLTTVACLTLLVACSAALMPARAQTISHDAPTQAGVAAGKLYVPAEEDYLRWPLPASEAKYANIEGTHIKSMLNEVVAISRKTRDDGARYWGRFTGFSDAPTQQWTLKQFQRIGLEQVRVQPLDLPPQWWPASWEASVSN